MEAQSANDGSMRFKLGPVEKLFVFFVLGAAGSCVYWVVTNVQTLVTQQAVTNSKLTNIDDKISDVPSLRTQVTKLEVRVEALEQKDKEKQDMRGLK